MKKLFWITIDFDEVQIRGGKNGSIYLSSGSLMSMGDALELAKMLAKETGLEIKNDN